MRLDTPTRIGLMPALAAAVLLSFTPRITAFGVFLPVVVLFLWVRHHGKTRQALARCVACGNPVRSRQ